MEKTCRLVWSIFIYFIGILSWRLQFRTLANDDVIWRSLCFQLRKPGAKWNSVEVPVGVCPIPSYHHTTSYSYVVRDGDNIITILDQLIDWSVCWENSTQSCKSMMMSSWVTFSLYVYLSYSNHHMWNSPHFYIISLEDIQIHHLVFQYWQCFLGSLYVYLSHSNHHICNSPHIISLENIQMNWIHHLAFQYWQCLLQKCNGSIFSEWWQLISLVCGTIFVALCGYLLIQSVSCFCLLYLLSSLFSMCVSTCSLIFMYSFKHYYLAWIGDVISVTVSCFVSWSSWYSYVVCWISNKSYGTLTYLRGLVLSCVVTATIIGRSVSGRVADLVCLFLLKYIP